MRTLAVGLLLIGAGAAKAATFEAEAALAIETLSLRGAELAPSVSPTLDTDAIASASLSQGPCETHTRPKYCKRVYDCGSYWGQDVPGGGRVDLVDGKCPKPSRCERHVVVDPSFKRMLTRLDLVLVDGSTLTVPVAIHSECRRLDVMLYVDAIGEKADGLLKDLAAGIAQTGRDYVNQYSFCYRKSAVLVPLLPVPVVPSCSSDGMVARADARIKPLSCASIDISAATFEEHR